MHVARPQFHNLATTHKNGLPSGKPVAGTATNPRPVEDTEPLSGPDSDSVSLSGTPALRAKLGSVGFLEAFSSLPAPFGGILDRATRAELEQALAGLESSGVKFSTKRTGLFSRLGSEYKDLSAAEVLPNLEAQLLEKERDPFLKVRTPWQRTLNIRDFNRVLALKEVVDGQGGQLLEAARSLKVAGLISDPESVATDLRAGDATYIMLERVSSYNDPEPDRIGSEDDLYFLDFLEGSGLDRGLVEPEVAAGLKHLHSENRVSRERAYRIYTQGEDYATFGLSQRHSSILVAREHLKDPKKLVETFEAYRATYRYELAPALAKAGNGEVPEAVRKTDGKFPVTTQLQAFAGVIEAASPLHMQDHKVRFGVHNLYSELVKTSTTEAQLFTRLQAVSPTLSSDGPQAALELLGELAAGKSPISMGPRETVFEELRRLTGSLSLAKAGVNLVRIPLAGEPQEERLELYSKIASSLPEESRQLAPEFYQEALIGRDMNRSLAENGQRFTTILGACTNLKQPGLAPAVYQALHQKARQGADLDQGLEDFVKAAVTGKSVAEALTHVARTLEPGSIEFLEDGIQVGDFSLDFG